MNREVDTCIGLINSLLVDAGFEIKVAVLMGGHRRYVFANNISDNLVKNFGSSFNQEELAFFKAAIESIIGFGNEDLDTGDDDDDDDDDDDNDNDNGNENDNSEGNSDERNERGDNSGGKENGKRAAMSKSKSRQVGSSGKITQADLISIRSSPKATFEIPITESNPIISSEVGSEPPAARTVKSKPISATRAEKLIEELVNEKWLARSGRDKLMLGVRVYAELGELCKELGLKNLPQIVTLR